MAGKTLILMRHAKSDWSVDGLSDHDRPLNKRGRKSADALGTWLRGQDADPDLVLCSTAARTRETLARLQLDVPVEFHEALYHATPATLMTVLSQANVGCVLMVGHNPGISELARQLADTSPIHDRFDDFPTGATWIAQFDIDNWKDLTEMSGETVAFVIPRELV